MEVGVLGEIAKALDPEGTNKNLADVLTQVALEQPELRWWELTSGYAAALVAAVTEERALELIDANPRTGWVGGWMASPPAQIIPPGPPAVEGVYFWYAE